MFRRIIGILLLVLSVPVSAYERELTSGAGKFPISGGADHPEAEIVVNYHIPKAVNKSSRVLFVIPGAGRNGDAYRDAWIDASEKYNVIILSPSYSDKDYPGFWSYNLGGMITDVKASKEKGIEHYRTVADAKQWLFDDFDRIFDVVSSALALETDEYDMFGHSAGGQVLHRMALFGPNGKARRIIAANSGWYTIPDKTLAFPYGLRGIDLPDEFYRNKLKSELVILLGELDDQNETRGDLARTELLDKQGTYRLARGKYFYEHARNFSTELGAEFNWKIKVVPNVGHDHKLMSKAAADFLYQPGSR